MDTIRVLQSIDFEDSILDTFERKQETTNVLVVESNSLNEKEDRFEDDWTIERKREIVNHCKATIASGGAVIVAEQGSKVFGFAVIEAET
ncbi:hypothetical protein R0K20_16030, partial [Staphylococcus sp. SIMBA_130]